MIFFVYLCPYKFKLLFVDAFQENNKTAKHFYSKKKLLHWLYIFIRISLD